MQQTPLFCFGSLMDWDVVSCVLAEKSVGLSMQPAVMKGYRVAKLPHESYPMLVQDQERFADGHLLYGLTQEHLDRIIFFEGEEYAIQPCRVETDEGLVTDALFFDEGIMPTAELTDWCFETWQTDHKPYLLRQTAHYMSYFGQMSAEEADYYWQNYVDEIDQKELIGF